MAKAVADCRHEVLDPSNGLFCCLCGASVAELVGAGVPVAALIMPYAGAKRYLGTVATVTVTACAWTLIALMLRAKNA